MGDKSHVLIVDDDTALLQALPQALALRMNDVVVDTCDSALEALGHIEQREYDAIVSDIKMPGMDGLTLLEKIHEVQPETPTLLITGHGEHDLAVRALRGGAYDFIQKPIDREYFVAALQRAIQTHQLRQQVREQQLTLLLHADSLEKLVQKRTEELIAANATKDKFLSIVSHELKTPLTNLKGMTKVLRRQVDEATPTEVVSRGLEDMERSLSRTEVLVEDLLDTSLMESNMFVLHRHRCDLVELCRSLLSEYTEGAGPDLTFHYLGQPIEVEVDRNRICQVLMNLLSNARKYAPQSSPITVAVQQSGYEATISICDTGVPIPEDHLPYIFEQFYRVPGIEVQNGARPGLGLGLYISRKIIERHGGRIEVQCIPGEGNAFSVILPLFIDPEAQNRDSISPTQHTQHTQAIWTVTTHE